MFPERNSRHELDLFYKNLWYKWAIVTDVVRNSGDSPLSCLSDLCFVMGMEKGELVGMEYCIQQFTVQTSRPNISWQSILPSLLQEYGSG